MPVLISVLVTSVSAGAAAFGGYFYFWCKPVESQSLQDLMDRQAARFQTYEHKLSIILDNQSPNICKESKWDCCLILRDFRGVQEFLSFEDRLNLAQTSKSYMIFVTKYYLSAGVMHRMMTNRKMIRQRVSTAVKDLVLVFLFDLCSIALPVKTVALFQTSTAEMSPELYKQVVKSAGERFDACYSDPQYWTEVMDGNGGYQEVYDGLSMYSLIYHRLKNLGVCSTLQAFELYAVNESHMKVIITYFNWLGIAGVSILVSVAFSLGAVYGGANPYLATFDCIGNIITSLVCSAMAISGALVLYLSFRLVRAFYFEDFTWSGTKTAYKRLHEAVREFHIRSWWEGFSTFVTVPCYQLVVLELLPCIVKVSGYAASGIATLVSTASKGVTQLQEVLRLALRGVPAPVSLPM